MLHLRCLFPANPELKPPASMMRFRKALVRSSLGLPRAVRAGLLRAQRPQTESIPWRPLRGQNPFHGWRAAWSCPVGKIAHDVQNLRHQLGIKCRGHLIQQHKLRFHGQCPRDGHALLLPAGKAVRVFVGLGLQADALQQTMAILRRRPAPSSKTVSGCEVTFSSTLMCGNRLKL